jgi:hypothetical protein
MVLAPGQSHGSQIAQWPSAHDRHVTLGNQESSRPACQLSGPAHRRPWSRHDQQPGRVVDGSTGGPQGGLADPEVVTAQEQVNRVRAAGGRRHHHRDHRPCRTAGRRGIPVHAARLYPAALRSRGTLRVPATPCRDVREGVRGFGPVPARHEPGRLAAPHHDQHLHHRLPDFLADATTPGNEGYLLRTNGGACPGAAAWSPRLA